MAFEAAPPIDPHGTLSAQVGHGAGADSYQTDVSAGQKKFGFTPYRPPADPRC